MDFNECMVKITKLTQLIMELEGDINCELLVKSEADELMRRMVERRETLTCKCDEYIKQLNLFNAPILIDRYRKEFDAI